MDKDNSSWQKVLTLISKQITKPKPTDNHTRLLITTTTNTYYIIPNPNNPESNSVPISMTCNKTSCWA